MKFYSFYEFLKVFFTITLPTKKIQNWFFDNYSQ